MLANIVGICYYAEMLLSFSRGLKIESLACKEEMRPRSKYFFNFTLIISLYF